MAHNAINSDFAVDSSKSKTFLHFILVCIEKKTFFLYMNFVEQILHEYIQQMFLNPVLFNAKGHYVFCNEHSSTCHFQGR